MPEAFELGGEPLADVLEGVGHRRNLSLSLSRRSAE